MRELISESLIRDEERMKARLGGCGDEMPYSREEEVKAFKRNLEASHVTRSKYLSRYSNESSLEETSLYGKCNYSGSDITECSLDLLSITHMSASDPSMRLDNNHKTILHKCTVHSDFLHFVRCK
jgi:hypothetical protein